MAEFIITEDRGQSVLVLRGDITIEHADQLKKVLLKLLREERSVLVDGGDITAVDVSAVQLLCSAYLQARNQKTDFRLTEDFQKRLQTIIEEMGLLEHSICRNSSGSGECMWLTGGNQ